jgi:hypothetical protein
VGNFTVTYWQASSLSALLLTIACRYGSVELLFSISQLRAIYSDLVIVKGTGLFIT